MVAERVPFVAAASTASEAVVALAGSPGAFSGAARLA